MESFRRYLIRIAKEKDPELAQIIELYEEINLILFYVHVWLLEDLMEGVNLYESC